MKYVKTIFFFLVAVTYNFLVLPASISIIIEIVWVWIAPVAKAFKCFSWMLLWPFYAAAGLRSLKSQTCTCWTVTWCRNVRGRILARVSLNDVIAAVGDIKWLQCGTACRWGGHCCPQLQMLGLSHPRTSTPQNPQEIKFELINAAQ